LGGLGTWAGQSLALFELVVSAAISLGCWVC